MERNSKNFAIAILFALILGPIGLLYAGFWSGVIMTFIMFISAFIPKVNILLVLLLWLACPYWSIYVCTKHNEQ